MSQKVSVIIPVYNAAGSLERCVESIVYGELRDIDIILIEDCSKDNSWDICCDLSERFKNVRCFQNERNSGVSFTRNHGLGEANSEYILFVDSDDWVSRKYAKTLLETAEKYQESLVICGLHFRDEVASYRRDYLWDNSGSRVNVVEQEQFFDLPDRFLLQQIWNKIFHRDVIEQHHIRFDESQSMGEDFQFVLDYMEAAQTKQCVVLNEPLYYYIRANSTSLMSKFGLVENTNEYKRLEKLRDLSGRENSVVQQQYEKAIQSTKYNYIYQVFRDASRSKSEKLDFIEQIMQDGKAQFYYAAQRKLIAKEKTSQLFGKCKSLPLRVKGKLQRSKRDKVVAKARKALTAQDFTIISQNCIGGIFYHDMGMRFLSPTINLFFKGSDFVRFVQRLEYYMSIDLEMQWDEDYPIGVLDDVKIYFMHYHTCHEAKETWERRKERIQWDKIIVFSTDMEDFTDETYEEWKKISYPKVLFTATCRDAEGTVYFPEYMASGKVPDLIPMREFYKNNMVMDVVNSSERKANG